jgi:hypothetical protein
MGARNEGQTVVVIELLRNVLAEGVTGTAGTDAPAATVVGIGPQKIAEREGKEEEKETHRETNNEQDGMHK